MTNLRKTYYSILLGLCAFPVYALNIPQIPLNMATGVPPNIMVLYDNSQSMDGTMAGKIVTGSPEWAASIAPGGTLLTRGDIARSVILKVIERYRKDANWGIMTFGVTGFLYPYNTHAYFFGSDATMNLTNDCVNGISASHGGLRCLPNPSGTNFFTYEKSGDDPDVNDILYSNWTQNYFWGTSQSVGTSASPNTVYYAPTPMGSVPLNSAWTYGSSTYLSFSYTDAGFLPGNPPYTRQVWIKRGWGYNQDITGAGVVRIPIASDSPAHFSALSQLLQYETASTSTPEIKNSAIFTPLAGSLDTAESYFAGATSPINASLSCQNNYVLMATDGNPTGRKNGNLYNPSEWTNPGTQAASFADATQAYKDVYDSIRSLRKTRHNSADYDVKTFIVGLGDSVQNATSVAGLNNMAILGGTAQAYLATDEDGLMSAFDSIMTTISTATGSAVGLTANSGEISSSARLFQVTFNTSDWSGMLRAWKIKEDGSVGDIDWNAAELLKTRDFNSRDILTYKPSAALGSRGIKFKWPVKPDSPTATELDLEQIAMLNRKSGSIVDNLGKQRVSYLIGDTSREASRCAGCANPFRDRPHGPLGDIINSGATYVANGDYGYADNIEKVPYSNYLKTKKTRVPLVLVGSNDGMLHAFKAGDGTEEFGYIPAIVFGKLSDLTDVAYSHHYMVDGTPTVGDLFYDGKWHTLAVAGLRGGFKGLYAIEPYASSKSAIPRWEFTSSEDDDMGYVWGKPLIVKTNDGKWSVIVNNGYNSANGKAALFILDAETGSIKKKIVVESSTATARAIIGENGLSEITSIDSNRDGVIDTVYAGDLGGSLWKFDLSSVDSNNWVVAFEGKPLFTVPTNEYSPQLATGPLTGTAVNDALSGRPRAITVRPTVTRTDLGDFMVTFGTGRYIELNDPGNTDLNMQFGILDKNTGTVKVSDLIQQRFYTGFAGEAYRSSSYAVGTPSAFTANEKTDNRISEMAYKNGKKGWMFMLSKDPVNPVHGERVIFRAVIRGKRVIISSMKPNESLNACGNGQEINYITELDVYTGNRLDVPFLFDTNMDGVLDSSDASSNSMMMKGVGGVYTSMEKFGESGTNSDENFYAKDESGNLKKIKTLTSGQQARRVAWFQLR